MKYISVILASFSVVMCVVLAYFLGFTELLSDRLVGNARYFTIAILCAYGTIRLFRVLKQIKQIKNEANV